MSQKFNASISRASVPFAMQQLMAAKRRFGLTSRRSDRCRGEHTQSADGATDIYLGPKAPDGKSGNWLVDYVEHGDASLDLLPSSSPLCRAGVTSRRLAKRHSTASMSPRFQLLLIAASVGA
jgi:hypothetical protein